jgi:hypothetical protein
LKTFRHGRVRVNTQIEEIIQLYMFQFSKFLKPFAESLTVSKMNMPWTIWWDRDKKPWTNVNQVVRVDWYWWNVGWVLVNPEISNSRIVHQISFWTKLNKLLLPFQIYFDESFLVEYEYKYYWI